MSPEHAGLGGGELATGQQGRDPEGPLCCLLSRAGSLSFATAYVCQGTSSTVVKVNRPRPVGSLVEGGLHQRMQPSECQGAAVGEARLRLSGLRQ